jgi:VWFA-related protein
MRFQRTILLSGVILLAAAASPAQQAQPPAPPTVIRTETKLVLVDVVVTGKKGAYVEDLELKNFKVWEDNKEQVLKTFSSGADPKGPAGQQRYIVLFFDNSTMGKGEQMRAREAAARFVESNAGPDRLMAVVNFTGALQIAQNFTGDIDRLKQVVGGIKTSAVAPGPEVASLGMPRLGGGFGAYGARTMLLSLRTMAQNLAGVPGRKSLILFTSGFPLSNDADGSEARSQANAAVDACNKANVAVYPIDVRGLGAGLPGVDIGPSFPGPGHAALEIPPAFPGLAWRSSGIALATFPVVRIASFFLSAAESEQQGGRGGGGSTGGSAGSPGGGTTSRGASGGSTGGSSGGNPGSTGGGTTRGTTPGGTGTGGGRTNPNPSPNTNPTGRPNNPYNTNNPNNPNNPLYNNPSRMNIPRFPPSATDNQQIMYLLADGTGGFVITNTNDLLGGMQKIGKEQNQYYIVGYTPPESPEGSCHILKVKVDQGGTTVRSRAGYCNVKSRDALAGNPIEKTLESRATASAAGTIAASMRAPFFYTGANTARIAVAMEIPADAVKFEKVKGKMHAGVNVLGIAYNQDGTVAARFSDVVKLDFENQKEVKAFQAKPLHYENQFDVAVGVYNLKVVFDSGGASFGKLESPLAINAYDGKDFAVSGIAFSTVFVKVTDAEANLDSLLLEGRSPLVAANLQFTPTGAARFKAADKVAMYFELYDPALMDEKKPTVAVNIHILDAKTLALKQDSGNVKVNDFVKAGSPMIPTGMRLPIEGLAPGQYRLEIRAVDSTGSFATRTADFEIL